MSRAIEVNPDMDKAYYYRGFLYLVQKYFIRAEEDFVKAASFSPAYQKTVLDFLKGYLNSPVYESEVRRIMQRIEQN